MQATIKNEHSRQQPEAAAARIISEFIACHKGASSDDMKYRAHCYVQLFKLGLGFSVMLLRASQRLNSRTKAIRYDKGFGAGK